jgi:hypothetical protein
MIKTYYQSLVWFRHTISHWYDSDILSVIGIQWLIIFLNHSNYWYYVLIIPITDDMSESEQWLIIYLNHTNDWRYVWIKTYYKSLVWCRHIISDWYDSDILSVIDMIQVYYQWLVWFGHIISDWYDSGILSVIGIQSLMICLHHTNDL